MVPIGVVDMTDLKDKTCRVAEGRCIQICPEVQLKVGSSSRALAYGAQPSTDLRSRRVASGERELHCVWWSVHRRCREYRAASGGPTTVIKCRPVRGLQFQAGNVG